MAAVTIERTPRVTINVASGSCSYAKKPGHMLETPSIRRYSPLLEAVTTRPVRTISRKDGISGREDQEDPTEDRVLPGGLYGRGRQLQRLISVTQGLSGAVEDLPQFQCFAEGSGHTGPLQAALGLWQASRSAQWCGTTRPPA